MQELANVVLAEHFSQVVHTSTDCVLSYGDFQQLCHKVSKTCALATAANQVDHFIELQLLEESKIVRHQTADGMEVSLEANVQHSGNTHTHVVFDGKLV